MEVSSVSCLFSKWMNYIDIFNTKMDTSYINQMIIMFIKEFKQRKKVFCFEINILPNYRNFREEVFDIFSQKVCPIIKEDYQDAVSFFLFDTNFYFDITNIKNENTHLYDISLCSLDNIRQIEIQENYFNILYVTNIQLIGYFNKTNIFKIKKNSLCNIIRDLLIRKNWLVMVETEEIEKLDDEFKEIIEHIVLEDTTP